MGFLLQLQTTTDKKHEKPVEEGEMYCDRSIRGILLCPRWSVNESTEQPGLVTNCHLKAASVLDAFPAPPKAWRRKSR